MLWFAYAPHLAHLVEALILPGILLALLLALCGRCLWIACLLLAPFAMLAPLEMFYIVRYHTHSTAEIMATLAATTPAEVRGYLGSLSYWLPLASLFSLLLALACAWLCWRTRLHWRGRLRRWIVMLGVGTPLASLAWGAATTPGSMAARWQAATSPWRNAAASVEPGYPFGLPLRYASYRQQAQAVRRDARQFAHFNFHARRADPKLLQRQIYVLVIGESSARDHWQLFGYDRPTNPELSRLANLVPIRHFITSWPETLHAVPLLLTRRPIRQNKKAWDEPSFLPALTEAGFSTWWISNQYPIGRFDSPIAVYAHEAQHTVWVNHAASWDNPGSYDGALLPPLERAIASTHHDLFIVLHMLGSHQGYRYRYPPSYNRFGPGTPGFDSHSPHWQHVQDSYDNTIVYTDHVLTQIIDMLKHSGAVTALWYESDHGEVLPSPTCHKEGHGYGTSHEYRIPALFWYSNAYQKLFPKRVDQLRANADKRTMSADTFASVLDMADVTFPGLDHSWSLFSPTWRYRTRTVGQFWYSDFDHDIFSKKCDIVIPPKPTTH